MGDTSLLILTTSLSIVGFLFGLGGLGFGLYVFSELKALRNSTHSIQYVPLSQEETLDANKPITDEQIANHDLKKGKSIGDPFDMQSNEVIL